MYIKRKEEGRRLISIEECVEDAIAGFHHYVQNNQERLISAAWRSLGEQEVTPTMKQSLTLFLSLLNFFKKNTNNKMTRWKILCIRIFVEGGFNVPEKWYEHKALPSTENGSFKIPWDFNIHTDHIIEHRRPDIIIVDKTNKKAQTVDFAVPADRRIEISQHVKIENY